MADDLWTGCPPAEVLALWCERKLVGCEKRQLELHLIVCDRCRHTVIAVCDTIDVDTGDEFRAARNDINRPLTSDHKASNCREGSESQSMVAIFRGRTARVVATSQFAVVLELRTDAKERIEIAIDDRDLILDPTPDDLALSEMFERGDVGAFEYPDGHTFPPNREIRQMKPRRGPRIH